MKRSILVLLVTILAGTLAGCNPSCKETRNYESQIQLIRTDLVNIIAAKNSQYTTTSCAWLDKAAGWLTKKSPKLQYAAWDEPYVNDPNCNEDGFHSPFSRNRSGYLTFNSQTMHHCTRSQGHPDRIYALEQLSGEMLKLAQLFSEMCKAPGDHTYAVAQEAIALIDGQMQTNGETLIKSYCPR